MLYFHTRYLKQECQHRSSSSKSISNIQPSRFVKTQRKIRGHSQPKKFCLKQSLQQILRIKNQPNLAPIFSHQNRNTHQNNLYRFSSKKWIWNFFVELWLDVEKKLTTQGSVGSGRRWFSPLPSRPALHAPWALALLRLGRLDAGLALALVLADCGHVRDDLGHASDSLGAAFAEDQPLADLQILWMLHEPVKARQNVSWKTDSMQVRGESDLWGDTEISSNERTSAT